MRRSSIALLVAALVAVSLLASGAAAGPAAKQAPAQAGTVIFGAEQEPSDSLNGLLACCNLAWASWIANPVLRGAFQVQPNFAYKPYIISRARITRRPFTVTYDIRPQAKWSDNVPITAADFVFTWQTYINPRNEVASRAGYEDIRRAVTINRKRVRFIFKQPYAAWKDLFSGPYGILPRHALVGEDFNRVWERDLLNPKNQRPIASGPFVFQSYQRGSQLTLVRNNNFWGPRARVNQIVFRFLTNTNTEIQQMRGGEVDAIYPQPQLALAELRNQRGISLQTNAGTTWEHIDFGMSDKANPLMRRLFVRQAIAYAINRPALVQRLFSQISPRLRVLHNPIYLSNSPFYRPVYNMYTYNPNRARQLLQGNGCTRGGDGIFSCGGQRLSFTLKSTAGNQRRALVFEIVQAQLRDVGIELKSDFRPAGVIFGDDHISGGNYDLALFAWVGSPDPGGNVEIFRCGGDQNYQQWCNRQATRFLDQSHRVLNERTRANIMNRAAAIMARELPTLPLYQLPTFLAYKTSIRNMRDNPTQEGFSWNIEQWRRAA